ncbi:tyrosine-type recombinase/integrase [Hyunsoonleella sp. SJ7]|uniref:Tyrosine-type recombinase/integrase n=1 Tax=Hyunsoonleella aquatilis TaxID=2762758 RepID=A0A923HG93_9FLAO|nr:site-specific integrase [Hyunsoonleella aquatilis]MBC3759718.1 tyrosine-type recombinase/integrase [Hyunsoonleella aquatilis]
MRSTFNLKESKKDGLTSIRLIAYFKDEDKKFVYSTGEVIHPEDWDFENKQPKHLTGRTKKSNEMRTIKHQLDRYSKLFTELTNRYKVLNQDITIKMIRKEFDHHFKRVKAVSNRFFEVYDIFLQEKKEDQSGEANSTTTIKRYEYNKKLLQDFQEYSKSQIHFKNINDSFYNNLINYCVTEKKHAVNTLSRNIGLFKTFMYWAFNNNHTYKDDFKNFKNIKKEVTEEIALTLDQVKEAYEHDFRKNKRLERVRDLFVFGCATGMRYSNYSLVSKSDVYNGHIHIRDKKNTDKLLSIPLNDFSKAILEKYDYELPLLANQNFNDYIKDVFEALGYTQTIKKTAKIGNKVIEKEVPLYKRISSHTARRSFITIMKNNKIPDKVIMSYTGHRSLEVFNKYYKPNEDDKVDFMNSVWSKLN